MAYVECKTQSPKKKSIGMFWKVQHAIWKVVIEISFIHEKFDLLEVYLFERAQIVPWHYDQPRKQMFWTMYFTRMLMKQMFLCKQLKQTQGSHECLQKKR